MAILHSIDAIDATEITVRPDHRLTKGVIYSAVLVACLYAGYRTAAGIADEELRAPVALLVAWFSLWSLVALLLGFTLLWIALGRETMSIQSSELTLQHEI